MLELKAEVSVISYTVFEYQWSCPKCNGKMIRRTDVSNSEYIKCIGPLCQQILYREAPGLYSSKKQEG